jgi:hypothetical protein
MDGIREGLELGNNATTLAGKVFGPWFTRRQSDADSRAAIQAVLADQVATYIEDRPNDPVMMDAIASCNGRFDLDNLVRVVRLATDQLNEDARPDLITDDWGANFRDKAHTCSDPDMATLWAQLLAGEANKPGSYSRKTVNVLGDMDKTDAELFSNFCCFQLMGYSDEMERFPVILSRDADVYKRHGITTFGLPALQSLGLINVAGSLYGGISLGSSVKCSFLAHSKGMLAFVPHDGRDDLCEVNIGHVSFTRIGMEMSHLCLPLRTPKEFVTFLIAEWGTQLHRFTIKELPLTANFIDGTFQANPDLGRIVKLDSP